MYARGRSSGGTSQSSTRTGISLSRPRPSSSNAAVHSSVQYFDRKYAAEYTASTISAWVSASFIRPTKFSPATKSHACSTVGQPAASSSQAIHSAQARSAPVYETKKRTRPAAASGASSSPIRPACQNRHTHRTRHVGRTAAQEGENPAVPVASRLPGRAVPGTVQRTAMSVRLRGPRPHPEDHI